MCGIVGFIKGPDATEIKGTKKYPLFSKPITNMDDVLIDLGKFSNRRGGDNHGLMVLGEVPWTSIKGDTKRHTLRHCTADDEFVSLTKTQGYYLNRSVENSVATFLHTRKASSGGKDIKAAHPVVHEDIVLMHNGTLESGWRSDASVGCLSDTTCIAENLHDKGAKWVYENLSGPMTMVWYDGNINIIRHKDRPLYSLYVQGNTIFASERWMIEAALDLNGIEYEGHPELIAVDTHLIYDNQGELLSTETYTPKKPTPATSYYDSHWYRSGNYRSPTSTIKKGGLPVVVNEDKHLLAGSSIKFGQPIIGSPISFVPYEKNKDRGCLRLCYDTDSSVAPLSDNLAFDIIIHGVDTRLGSYLVRYAPAVLTKATGVSTSVLTSNPLYSEAFVGNHLVTIPVFDYFGDDRDTKHGIGTELLQMVQDQLDDNTPSVVNKVTLKFPDWDEDKPIREILQSTRGYFNKYHWGYSEMYSSEVGFPFIWNNLSQKFFPDTIKSDIIVPPVYEARRPSKVH